MPNPNPHRLRHLAFTLLLLFLILLIVASSRHPLYAAPLPANFTETLITNVLDYPSAMAIAPDGRIFVCERDGTVFVVKNDVLLPDPFITISPNVIGDHGLLGIVLDPEFQTNGYVYFYYTVSEPSIHNRIVRYTAAGDAAVPESVTTIIDLDPVNQFDPRHDGGGLHFGADGKLYVGTGDGVMYAQVQTLSSLHGKILRLNSDGTIPSDNPYYETLTGNLRAIWARGFRNPFTFALQPETDLMLINDVGEITYEEINLGVAGANYGWPTCEGPCNPSNPLLTDPFFYYQHLRHPTVLNGCALVGGTFYNPPTVSFPPDYVGDYFFSDWCSGWISKMEMSTRAVTVFATAIVYPLDLDVSSDGALYYLYSGAHYGTQPGGIYKIQFSAPHGLTGSYFNQPDFQALTLTRLDPTIDFTFDPQHPVPALAPNNFSARWRGTLHPTTSGSRKFIVKTDGGVRLTINGTRVIDALDSETPTTHRAKLKLNSNQTYNIKLEYRHTKNPAYIHWYWKINHAPKELVPSDVLSPQE